MSRVGEIHNSVKYGAMLIKEKLDKDYYVVEFVNTGFTTKSQISKILNGKVKDHLAPCVFGVGITSNLPTKTSDGRTLPDYNLWCGMLERCYSDKYQQKKPTYIGCSVSENFRYYSYFKEWCCRQVGFSDLDNKGRKFVLDKDILLKGNKLYSENTCCFVPVEINSALTKCNSRRGLYPVGVTYDATKTLPFQPTVSFEGKNKRLERCASAEEAFYIYKQAKEAIIKSLAEKYKNLIDYKVYEALLKYEVEITD